MNSYMIGTYSIISSIPAKIQICQSKGPTRRALCTESKVASAKLKFFFDNGAIIML